MATIFDVLKKEHRDIKSQLEKLLEICDRENTVDYKKVEKVFQELQLHMTLEETVLYPRVEQEKKVAHLVKNSYEDHQQLKDYMRGVKKGLEIEMLSSYLERILDSLEYHVKEEEGRLFPALQREWEQKTVQKLTDEFQALREKEMAYR